MVHIDGLKDIWLELRDLQANALSLERKLNCLIEDIEKEGLEK